MASHPHLVVATKLAPPRRQRQLLHRDRLTQRLLTASDYRLTIVHAGAGYGKSTALAALVNRAPLAVWYHLEAEDAHPLRFLSHLLHAFAASVPDLSQAPLALLEQWDQAATAPDSAVIDALVNALSAVDAGPITLVLDDAHHLNQSAETLAALARLVQHAPANLHTVIATRYPLHIDQLATLRLRGQVLDIGQDELAFTPDEIAALFQQRFDHPLSAEQATQLATTLDGWAIALPLVWQRMQRGDESIAAALTQVSGTTSDLFAFLVAEVLQRQPRTVRRFLRETALLRRLDAATCDCLRNADDSTDILDYLQTSGLFVTELGGTALRYHHLFRDVLCHRLSAETTRHIHQRAARCYTEQGDFAEAIYHHIAAESFGAAAELLARHGRRMLAVGQLDTVAAWISALPPEQLTTHPVLLLQLGDVARFHSRFDTALGWYQQAEAQFRAQRDINGVGSALRAQARVYLDTFNPTQAEHFLQEALRISDGHEDRETRSRLLDLLAENALNQGRLADAEQFREQVWRLQQSGHDAAALPLRLLLRTGRLAEARVSLERHLEAERHTPVLRSRAHRETVLLLALIYSMMGEPDIAQRTARAGIERGTALNAPFVTSVAYARLGHALLLDKTETGFAAAAQAFRSALRIAEDLDVPRLRVEPFWGLCQVYGFRGQVQRARDSAESGIAIAQQAGDEWVIACIRATLGASYCLAGEYEQALAWLAQAATSFRECNDTHGEAVALLWHCLVWHSIGDTVRLTRDLDAVLGLARDHGYAFLFQRRTLMGPTDPRCLIPLLLFARRHSAHAAHAHTLLEQLGLSGLERHPGYRLRVETLGAFRLWRGAEELSSRAWKRQKARQLFQLFLTYRRSRMHREQIIDTLWPDLSPDDALRDFKIAYNTLCKVLEPDRKRNTPSAYIVRDGSRYGLRPEADVWFDAAVFDELIRDADRLSQRDAAQAQAGYRQALALYQGDYLEEYPYEEWASQERKRLLNRYLRSAERLARLLLQDKQWDEAIEVCNALLARDDCWEPAYRMLMTAYARQGNRTQVIRTLDRCRQTLHDELAVAPTAATLDLYDSLT